MATKRKKKSNVGGARVPRFTDAEVRQIRKLAAGGMRVVDIAKQFGANYGTTTRVVKGWSYPHMLAAEPKAKKRKAEPASREPEAKAPTGDKTTVIVAGDSLRDCDPRRERHGVVLLVSESGAAVKWNTGKETNVKLSTIHRKPESKKGFLLVAPVLPNSTQQQAEPAAAA
jgi:hypothetical protein